MSEVPKPNQEAKELIMRDSVLLSHLLTTFYANDPWSEKLDYIVGCRLNEITYNNPSISQVEIDTLVEQTKFYELLSKQAGHFRSSIPTALFTLGTDFEPITLSGLFNTDIMNALARRGILPSGFQSKQYQIDFKQGSENVYSTGFDLMRTFAGEQMTTSGAEKIIFELPEDQYTVNDNLSITQDNTNTNKDTLKIFRDFINTIDETEPTN